MKDLTHDTQSVRGPAITCGIWRKAEHSEGDLINACTSALHGLISASESLPMAWSMPPEEEDSACDADAEPAKEERAGGGGWRRVKGKNSF